MLYVPLVGLQCVIVVFPDHTHLRFAANPSNPAHEVSFPPKYVDLYEKKPKSIKIIWYQNFTILRIYQYETSKYLKTFYTKHSNLVFKTT